MMSELHELIRKSKITFRKTKNLKYLAQATVDLGGLGCEVRSFLLGNNSKNKATWCMPPHWGKAGKIPGKKAANYFFFIDDDEEWQYLHDKIVDQYLKQAKTTKEESRD